MASISTDQNKHKRLLVNINGKRRSRRLGRMSNKDANALRELVEDLMNDSQLGRPNDPVTVARLQRLPANTRNLLAGLGLIRNIDTSRSVAEVVDLFMQSLSAKPGTQKAYGNLRRNLKAYFPGKLFSAVTHADAERFVTYLKQQELAAATVSRRIISCRTIWKWAGHESRGYVSSNPFAEIKAGQQTNERRKAYVDASTIDRLLEKANPEMSMRLVLARYEGFRIPSEALALRWEDIDFDRNLITVQSIKTEHHGEAHARRVIPLFQEARIVLQNHRRERGPVFDDRRDEGIWKALSDLCKRCKVETWPKLWHNLRASCQTDLSKTFPVYDVCRFLGNSLEVASQHYLMTTEYDPSRAQFRSRAGVRTTTQTNADRMEIMDIPQETPINGESDGELNGRGRINNSRDKSATSAGFSDSRTRSRAQRFPTADLLNRMTRRARRQQQERISRILAGVGSD